MNLSKAGEIEMTMEMAAAMAIIVATPIATVVATPMTMAKSQMKMALMKTDAKLFRHTIPVDANFDASHIYRFVLLQVSNSFSPEKYHLRV